MKPLKIRWHVSLIIASFSVYNFDLAPGVQIPVLSEDPYEVRIKCEDDDGKKTEVTTTVSILVGEDCQWNGPNPLPCELLF